MFFDVTISHSLVAILMHLITNGAYAFENNIASSASLEMRKGPVRLCGVQNSRISCPEGFCCSEDGHCGKGRHYCDSPQCQFQYGSACDANKIPNGTTTFTTPRPKFGNVAYGGAGIHNCTVPGTVALTFDDGPSNYTSLLLDILKKSNVTATFFLTNVARGKYEFDNQSAEFAKVVRRMHADGHQLGSHTWSHEDLSSLSHEERVQEMVKNEMAFRNLFGFFPTYMRPPYGDCTSKSNCTEDIAKLGYHIIYWNLYTQDLKNKSPERIQNSKNIVENAFQDCKPSTCSHIVYGHDTEYQTANLTEYIIHQIQAKGYKAVTIGECLSDPAVNWYRNATTGKQVASKKP
ncbi:hypothetical protein N7499_004545 [Penicillium canescens]|nr:hypothetical protein N7499_004545 [Penicillium canescens]KAJ6161701.1 hypothetical protein N7485_009931 [Penicillium canescens]